MKMLMELDKVKSRMQDASRALQVMQAWQSYYIIRDDLTVLHLSVNHGKMAKVQKATTTPFSA